VFCWRSSQGYELVVFFGFIAKGLKFQAGDKAKRQRVLTRNALTGSDAAPGEEVQTTCCASSR